KTFAELNKVRRERGEVEITDTSQLPFATRVEIIHGPEGAVLTPIDAFTGLAYKDSENNPIKFDLAGVKVPAGYTKVQVSNGDGGAISFYMPQIQLGVAHNINTGDYKVIYIKDGGLYGKTGYKVVSNLGEDPQFIIDHGFAQQLEASYSTGEFNQRTAVEIEAATARVMAMKKFAEQHGMGFIVPLSLDKASLDFFNDASYKVFWNFLVGLQGRQTIYAPNFMSGATRIDISPIITRNVQLLTGIPSRNSQDAVANIFYFFAQLQKANNNPKGPEIQFSADAGANLVATAQSYIDAIKSRGTSISRVSILAGSASEGELRKFYADARSIGSEGVRVEEVSDRAFAKISGIARVVREFGGVVDIPYANVGDESRQRLFAVRANRTDGLGIYYNSADDQGNPQPGTPYDDLIKGFGD
ncbi:MAG: hypothetical protein ACMG6E_08490, partial [Candidatus Roizmanbacteria bacterium]